MKRVSVIIPVYNHAEELEACLASLKRQTHQPDEIIVVDDGSATPFVIPSEAEGPSTSLIRFEHNSGAPHARNAGFDKSSGDYVIFLDADAVLIPEALELMVKELDSHPDASFVYSSFYWGLKLFPSQAFDVSALKRQNYIHTSTLMRRKDFPRFDESIKKFQDWDLFLTMIEQGKYGRFIERPLFTIKPRKNGGMSDWLPAFVYDLPWSLVNWMPKAVRKYRDAEQVIHKKHKLTPKQEVFPATAYCLLLILSLEVLSYVSFQHPWFSMGLASFLGLAVLILTYRKPELGLAAVVIEHLIGSLGHLFWNVRILIVIGFMLGWIGHVIDQYQTLDWKSWLKGRSAWLAWGALLIYGVLRGLVLHQPYVWNDANAWGVLIMLPAILQISSTRPNLWNDLKPAIKAGLIWLFAESLFLFWFFSHIGGDVLQSPIYLWLRRTGVGEITQIKTGVQAYRIFLQSQIYAVLLAVYLAGTRIAYRQILWLSAALAVILISFSRSFWIGTAVGIFLSFIFVLRRKIGILRHTGLLIAACLIGVLGVTALSNWSALVDLVGARATVSDAAASSRWELLAAMREKIAEAPILGHGFGATVTFTSQDPRIIQTTGGITTTYAFEWGWLDFWLKLGILGIPLMLWLLLSIIRRAGWEYLPIIAALAAIHFFTPYLNHPLGLIMLMLIEAQTNKPPTK